MDSINGIIRGFLTSKKFIAMVAGQIMILFSYINHIIPSGLEGLALEKAELAGVESYVNRAVALLVAWVVAQGMADFGKSSNGPVTPSGT